MKKPSNKVLDKIDMTSILSNIPEKDTNIVYIDALSGQEHYRLLVWFGKQVKGSILELGTFRGHSALCLGVGGSHTISYDIEDYRSIKYKFSNIDFKIDSHGFESVNESFDLIFIDTMHDGVYESQVLDYLRKINWKGVVVMDDIILFPELSKLWESIPERKEDWTDIGHHSGTGIVFFE